MEPELITVPQFLAQYSISRSEFYRQVKKGAIPMLKLGTASRVRRKDAESWAASLPTYQGEAA